jgi:hypothetical protein
MTNESPLQNGEPHRESIERLAYQLWEERGRPWGTPDLDWFAAEQEISSAMHSDLHEPSAITAAKVVGSVLGSVAGLVTSIVDSVHSEFESSDH